MAMPFEFCDRCFELRALDAALTNTLGWVGMTADYQLKLASSQSEATCFWRWRGGTYGWPGNFSEAIISFKGDAAGLQQLCLRASPTGDAAAAVDYNGGQLVLPPECHAGPAVQQQVGQCDLFRWHAVEPENSWSRRVVRVFACPEGGNCSSPIPLLGHASNSSVAAFEVICDSSCGMGLNGAVWRPRGNVIVGSLIILALLPAGLSLVHTELRRRRYSVDDYQWPVRLRPLSVFLVFEVSWVTLLVALTPCTLWLLGNLWLNRADKYLPLMLPGAVGMVLCLRPDDPPVVFCMVSLFIALGCAAASIMVCMLLVWSIRAPGGVCSQPVFLQDCPWSGEFQFWVSDVLGVAFTSCMVLILVVFVTAQSRILLPNWRHGLWGPKALQWLWKTVRGGLLAAGSILVLLVVVQLLLSAVIREATPLERAHFEEQMLAHLAACAACLVSYSGSSPRVRLFIHTGVMRFDLMNRLQRFSGKYCYTVLDSASRPTVVTRNDTLSPAIPPGRAKTHVTKTRLIEASVPTGELNSLVVGNCSDCSFASLNAVPRGSGDAIVKSFELSPTGLCQLGMDTYPSQDSHHQFLSHAYHSELWPDVDLQAIWMAEGTSTGPILEESTVLRSQIGMGGYSRVYRADLGDRAVAVKAFLRTSYKNERELRRLAQEAHFALTLSHPNIVATLGKIVLQGPRPALVLELMNGGSLYRTLHERPSHAPPLSKELAHKLVHQVANGLAYLHDNGIVHRDIKTGNVLLTADPLALSAEDGAPRGGSEHITAKLCDFGIATRFGMEHSADVGTTRYMAPETVFGPYNHMADVYSYGLLAWEVTHGAIPFNRESSIAAMLLVKENARPSHDVPRCVSAALAELITACWHEYSSSRPSIADVCEQLGRIREMEFGNASC